MPTQELKRGFGLSTATYVVIASMVGTGILISPGFMMASLKNYPAIFGLWALGGALALCGAFCVAELAASLPQAGGEYVYLKEAYGPMPAFLSGWTSFILGFSAPLAVIGHVAAKYFLTPFTAGENEADLLIKTIAAVLIVVVTLPNLIGHRQSAWTQNLTTIFKLALFIGLIVLAFLFGRGQLAHLAEGRPIGQIKWGDMATQLFYVMFAYSGWNAASYMAGEVKSPAKTLPRALILGTALVTVLYLGLNCVFAWAVPLGQVGFDNAMQVPNLAVENLFGPRAASIFSVLLGVTFLSTANAFVITGPRIYYAMAKDGLFPSVAARLSAKGQVPACAMVAQSVCAIVILFVTDFANLYRYASVGLSIFALLFIAAVYVLRYRRPDLHRPFRTPGYPIVPGFFMLVILFMTFFAFKQWPKPSIISLASILAGIPIYYIWSAIRRP
ncbi:MAG: APC family permease [Planctomycetota bacterium]